MRGWLGGHLAVYQDGPATRLLLLSLRVSEGIKEAKSPPAFRSSCNFYSVGCKDSVMLPMSCGHM